MCQHLRVYMLLDIFSRYVVGWTHTWEESGHTARILIRETAIREGVAEEQLTIHSDRGAPMVSREVSLMLADLRVTRSLGRPQVSNDNPYSESQFKTLKYISTFPERFDSFNEAREFLRKFFHWYNQDHHHEGMMMLTPVVVHSCRAEKVLEERRAVMTKAHSRNPERFVRGVSVVKPFPKEVWINKPKAPDSSGPGKIKPPSGNPMEMEKQGSVPQEVIQRAGPPEGPVLAITPDTNPVPSRNNAAVTKVSTPVKKWSQRC